MAKMKALYNLLDTFFIGIWGLTLIDLIPLFGIDLFSTIDSTIKTLMAFVGFAYFVITIPHKIKMQTLERQIKKEELEKITKENDK